MVETPPPARQYLEIYALPRESILYVMHPLRKKEQEGKRWVTVKGIHLSKPIKLSDHFVKNSRNYQSLNVDSVLSAVTKACQPEKGGRFFRAQLTGMKADDPQSAQLKLTEQ